MNSNAFILISSFGESWLSTRAMGLLLWGGLAVLTLALLILTRTRWGQAKPISKCVALSIFAHVLFMGYAYGTKLIFDVAPPPEEEVVQLAVLEADTEFVATHAPADALQPWDRLASDAASPAEVADPERLSTLFQPPSTPAAVTEPEIDATPDAQAIETPEPERPLPEATSVEAPPLLPAAMPEVDVAPTPNAAPEAPAPEPPAEPATAPQPGPELPRALVDQPLQHNETMAPPERIDQGPDQEQIQRLADVPVEAELADAAPDTVDRAAAASNLADGAGSAGVTAAIQDGTPAPLPQARVVPPIITANPNRRRPGDGKAIPKLYQMRDTENRLRVAEQFGGNMHTEGAVDNALRWLASAQSPDGHWDASHYGAGTETKSLGHDRHAAGTDADTGITGLALLAFLAAGHTHLEGLYQENVQHGLEFLLRSQAQNGNLYGQSRLFARMYCHGIASLALGEAYVMTGDHRLLPFLEKATRYTRNAQHATLGGWRYQPGDEGDMSQFGWQVMALRSAELAGIEIPRATREGMLRFLRRSRMGPHGGLAAYRTGERPSRTMTAEALACRYFLRVPLAAETVREASDLIHLELPGTGQTDLYCWYYATMALFHGQDPRWERWNDALQHQLLGSQRRSGRLSGSWDPDTVWGGYGGRVYSTAMATLCLEVYYRYLPLFDEAVRD